MDSSATEIRTGLQKNKEVRPQKGFGQKVNKHDSVGVREGGGGGGVSCPRCRYLGFSHNAIGPPHLTAFVSF